MGVTPYSNEKKQFFNVQGHQFTQRATEGQAGAVMRKINKKDGTTKEVWEFLFRDLSGSIISVDLKVTDFGKQYEIILEDLDEKMILQLQLESGYSDTLLARLPNINIDEPVKLVPYSFVPDGQTRRKDGINVFQNEVKIVPAFTKENPNGMPTVEKLAAAGVMSETPDADEWKIFFMQTRKFLAGVSLAFNEKLKGAKPVATINPDVSGEAPTEDSDSLPF